MATLHCDNITSEKRFLPEGSVLLLGDQILTLHDTTSNSIIIIFDFSSNKIYCISNQK